MTNSQRYLERPVSFVTAAKKLAKIRGDEGRAGGWIYNRVKHPDTDPVTGDGSRAELESFVLEHRR